MGSFLSTNKAMTSSAILVATTVIAATVTLCIGTAKAAANSSAAADDSTSTSSVAANDSTSAFAANDSTSASPVAANDSTPTTTNVDAASRFWIYDVFLSYRVEDVGNNFVSHLYKALTDKGINTFKDDEMFENGTETISSSRLKVIGESRLYIVVISKNYASSTWCLKELVKITEHIPDPEKDSKTLSDTVLPIFYDVDPSEVHNQIGTLEVAFNKSKRKFPSEVLQDWKSALTKAAQQSGWDARNRDEVIVIDQIVIHILKKLDCTCSKRALHQLAKDFRVREMKSKLYKGNVAAGFPIRRYDVFLSFRDGDTGNNFVSHLYKALTDKGIDTFKDDEKIDREKSLSPQLIEESRFCIVILSKNFASSEWCLEELVYILESKHTETKLEVFPIFYDIDRAEVFNQIGCFRKAFTKYKKDFCEDMHKVHCWESALKMVANIAGWNTKNRNEAILIDEIVNFILEKLI